ncbi:MAG: hypothetical protein QGG09_00045 [Pirellulaceae bacterium]|jgi:hypothetical protein|nr:hypothetical protein [Pirellulaceae bacterium]HJN10250.1 hypothetical protein [Pirellulaceae bacterium]
MAGDIEDFLRRAAQRRVPQPPPAPPAPSALSPRPEIQILGDEDVVDAYVVEERGILSGHNVGDHVSQHINTSEFGERISHMGEEIDHADDRMEAHLHGYFEHKLGDLGGETSLASNSSLDDDNAGQGPGDQETAAFDIQKLLHSPTNIRDAIVLSEILRKPEDRW